MAEKKVELRVAEALHNDVGRGIVRIDKAAMEALAAQAASSNHHGSEAKG